MNGLGEIIMDKVSKDCLVSLLPVKGIMTTYRVTNKEPATAPSFYVQNIYSSLNRFLSSSAVKPLSDDTKMNWIREVMTVVTNK